MAQARIKGAAKITTGSIMPHETSHDRIQWLKKPPLSRKGWLAIPAAMQDVMPD